MNIEGFTSKSRNGNNKRTTRRHCGWVVKGHFLRKVQKRSLQIHKQFPVFQLAVMISRLLCNTPRNRPTETRPIGLFPLTQWKFSLPVASRSLLGTQRIFWFYPAIFMLPQWLFGVTFTYPAYFCISGTILLNQLNRVSFFGGWALKRVSVFPTSVLVLCPLSLCRGSSTKKKNFFCKTTLWNSFSTTLPPFSLIRDFGKQNTRGNVSKVSVSLAWYRQIGSKSTNHSH